MSVGTEQPIASREISVRNVDARRLWALRVICLLILIALAAGLWLHWPYLRVEHRRLESWKIAFLWLGDITAFLWFVRFMFVHAILAKPLAPAQFSERRKRLWIVGGIVVSALLVDLIFTLWLMHDERIAYARGRVTQAQVYAMKVREREAATWYEIDCRFEDESGIARQAHVRVYAEHHVLPPELPARAARVLQRKRDSDGMLPLRYDPRLPARAWINGMGWEDENALYWFSLLTLFFQAIVTAIFLLMLANHTTGGRLPWWWNIYKPLPLAVETFWMLAMGLIDLALD